MGAVALALASSLSWGAADFLGGLKARGLPVLAVMAISQACSLVVIAAIVALRGEGPPGGDFVVPAALAAFAGLGGLAALYRGLAIGAMAVVSPVAGTAAAIPVLYGLLSGDHPSTMQAVGIPLAILGVVLAAREEPASGAPRAAAGAGLAVLAAAGFGTFMVLIDGASDADPLWAILVNRLADAAILGSLLAALRPRISVSRADLGALAVVGVLDMGANTLFAIASTKGLVSVVSVLASLYPVVTVALATAVLGERVGRSQGVGVAAVLIAVALIGAG